MPTFAEAAATVVEQKRAGWRSPASDPVSATGRPRRRTTRGRVIEAALAHVVRNPVEAAYARSDLFERGRRLMDDWAAYLYGLH